MDDLKQLYQALEPIEARRDTWVDKLIPFERFLQNGQAAAENFKFLRDAGLSDGRDIHPKLHDLVEDAFSK